MIDRVIEAFNRPNLLKTTGDEFIMGLTVLVLIFAGGGVFFMCAAIADWARSRARLQAEAKAEDIAEQQKADDRLRVTQQNKAEFESRVQKLYERWKDCGLDK